MTSIAKDVAAKASVALVALAMVFSLFAPAAQAQSTEDLQQMINDLLAQVAALQSQVGQGGDAAPMAAGVCPYTWTRDLSTGSTGMDVMKLQQFLNADPDTRVAMAGEVGGPGMETEYYGPATAAAVSKMQVKYRAEVLSPAGLVNPTGFFGPSSRAKANSACVAAPVVDDMDDDMMDDEDIVDDEDMMDDEDDFDGELSGSASLDVFEVDDASDTDVQEGAEDVEIGVFTIEFDNGDAEISRLDIAVLADGESDTDTREPWEVLETISLWVDGDKVAEVDAGDEDEYLDEDEGTLRFDDLGLIAMEGEQVEVVVGASFQGNIDQNDLVDWDVYAVEMRYFDADGVATTETDFEDLDDELTGTAATFNLEEEGEDEELDISVSSNNPESANIIVGDNSDTNDVTIFSFELESEEGDIELNDLVVLVSVDGATSTDIDDVINDAYLVINGDEFKAEPLGDEADEDVADVDPALGLSEGRSERATATSSIWYFFDIDGDVTVPADEMVEVELVIDFNETNNDTNYVTGTIIEASIGNGERGEWDVEGTDPLVSGTDLTGGATGEQHTLISEGLSFENPDITEERIVGSGNTPVDSAEFTLEVEITAVEDDFYIEDLNDQFAFTVTRNGVATTSSLISPSLTSDATKVGDRFRINSGSSETFTFKVLVNPGGDPNGQYRVTFDSVDFFQDSTGGTADTQNFIPAGDYRSTDVTLIN